MENLVETYNWFLIVMAVIAIFVFIALQFFEAGYGYLFDRRYGPPVPNKVGWVLMESPVFIAMCILWAMSDRMWDAVPLTLFAMFQLHYFQRSFIFPLLMRGNSKMPLGIVLMGMTFNTLNALMQGGWIFYIAPEGYYADWFSQPWIYIGITLFFAGMFINWQSDYIIRHLRKPGDTKHYIPKGGMFRYVSSANYFGEFMEWVGFAIASWSWAGVVFALWTFANLGPRSASLYKRYECEFGEEFTKLNRKRIIPFIW
jgi:3-oxo-5-alpha-steroid 4-dehydrogenase 1